MGNGVARPGCQGLRFEEIAASGKLDLDDLAPIQTVAVFGTPRFGKGLLINLLCCGEHDPGVPLEAARACLQCARENKRVVVRAETQAHSASPDEGHRPPPGGAVEALTRPQDVPLA